MSEFHINVNFVVIAMVKHNSNYHILQFNRYTYTHFIVQSCIQLNIIKLKSRFFGIKCLIPLDCFPKKA